MLPEILKNIEQAIVKAGWDFQRDALIAPGRFRLTGDSIREPASRVDYLLNFEGRPAAVVEIVVGAKKVEMAILQAANHARRIGLTFAMATDGAEWSLLNLKTGAKELLDHPPNPEEILGAASKEQKQSAWDKAIAVKLFTSDAHSRKLRLHQEQAIIATLQHFAGGERRACITATPGVGMVFAALQLAWKTLSIKALGHQRVLFLSSRRDNVVRAYQSFEKFGFGKHLVDGSSEPSPDARVYFSTVQALYREKQSLRNFESFASDYFDLIICDDCQSMMGNWNEVFKHFDGALQLGLMNSPEPKALEYFGYPVFSYSMAEAVDDGYLVPCLIDYRRPKIHVGADEDFYGGKLEKLIVTESQVQALASDLWNTLSRFDDNQQKSVVFCVNDSHAAMVTKELNRCARDSSFAVQISGSQSDAQRLLGDFQANDTIGPRVAVGVNLLMGLRTPQVSNVVLARPASNTAMLTNLIACGMLPCDEIGKRFCTVFDYYGAIHGLDTDWHGRPENGQDIVDALGQSISDHAIEAIDSEQLIGLAEAIRHLSDNSVGKLYQIWISKSERATFRNAIAKHDETIAALKCRPHMAAAEDVDIFAGVGFDWINIPTREDRVARFWEDECHWLRSMLGVTSDGDESEGQTNTWKFDFWKVALDHYSLYGLESLERGKTYQEPPFVNQFGSFQSFTEKYGGPEKLRSDLEAVKARMFTRDFLKEGDCE